MNLWCGVQLGANRAYLRFQHGEIALNGVLNDGEVDRKVAMNQPITHRGHGPPLDSGKARLEVGRQLCRRFTDDFKPPHDSILDQWLRPKLILRHLCQIGLNHGDAGKNLI